MTFSSPVDGFRLAYDRVGSGPPVVLFHGWPGDRTDYRDLVPLLAGCAEVIVPGLRGFGHSDKHLVDPEAAYSGAGQARSVIGLIDELGVGRAVIAGYDVGSFVAQTVAKLRPDLVRALSSRLRSPVRARGCCPRPRRGKFWLPAFHRLDLSKQLVDGRPEAVRPYLRHFWSHWSGPNYKVDEVHLDHLVDVYSPPGAFTASVGWYHSSSSPDTAYVAEIAPKPADRIGIPTTVLWQEFDPIFPREWSDRLDEFFTDVFLMMLDGVGHYTPLEAPDRFASAIKKRLEPRSN